MIGMRIGQMQCAWLLIVVCCSLMRKTVTVLSSRYKYVLQCFRDPSCLDVVVWSKIYPELTFFVVGTFPKVCAL